MNKLRPVLDIELAGQSYRLGANGRYSLHRPNPADHFGNVAFEHIVGNFPKGSDPSNLPYDQVDALLQLYGAAVEENERLKAALQKGG